MTPISRREFVAMTAAGAVATPLVLADALARPPRRHHGAGHRRADQEEHRRPWNADDDGHVQGRRSVDGRHRRGVTSMATVDVLQQAVKAGANSSSPPRRPSTRARMLGDAGWGGLVRGRGRAAGPGARAVARVLESCCRRRRSVAGDRLRAGHRSLGGDAAHASASRRRPCRRRRGRAAPQQARRHRLPTRCSRARTRSSTRTSVVILRLSEHWNPRKPDPRAVGLAAAMGWTKYRVGDDGLRYEVPPITMEALGGQLKKVLGTRGGIRAIGDESFSVQKIGLVPGYNLLQASLAMLPTVDVIDHRRSAGVGRRDLRAGRGVLGREERVHLARTRRQRSAGHAGVRRLAQDARSRSTGPIHFGR